MSFKMKLRPPMIVQLFKPGDMNKFITLLQSLPQQLSNELIYEAYVLGDHFAELYKDKTNMGDLSRRTHSLYKFGIGSDKDYKSRFYYPAPEKPGRFFYVMEHDSEEIFKCIDFRFESYQNLLDIDWEEVHIQLTKPIKFLT